MEDSCQLISDAAFYALEGADVPTHVATFGDVTVEEVGDWLPILQNEINPTVSSVCRR